jgi:ABC-type amino acid transport substrate-binding protein
MTVINTLTPGVLTVGTYGAFAPVCWRVGDTAHGKDVDFVRAFALRLGLELTTHIFSFNKIWERPSRDELDIAAAGIAPLASRTTPGVVWSDPYFLVQRSLLIRAGDRTVLRSMADFADRTIAVTRGSTADLDTMERKPASTRVVYYEDQGRAVQDLVNGTIDAFAEGDICANYLMSQDTERLAVVDVHQMAIPEKFVFAVRAASGLLEPLNAFIREWGDRY